jgi:hypothetical protein
VVVSELAELLRALPLIWSLIHLFTNKKKLDGKIRLRLAALDPSSFKD